MEWKPPSESKRRLGFFLLIPWVKIDDDGLMSMFKGIILKEYPADHTDCTDVEVISQQDRAKDSKEKQPVQVDLQKSEDSRESR